MSSSIVALCDTCQGTGALSKGFYRCYKWSAEAVVVIFAVIVKRKAVFIFAVSIFAVFILTISVITVLANYFELSWPERADALVVSSTGTVEFRPSDEPDIVVLQCRPSDAWPDNLRRLIREIQNMSDVERVSCVQRYTMKIAVRSGLIEPTRLLIARRVNEALEAHFESSLFAAS